MKLEEKFFNSFFYPFLIGVLLSMIVVTLFLFIFTNDYFDKKTGQNIVNLEKKFAKININSVNVLLTTTLIKIQASLNEQILFYRKLANKIDNIPSYDYTINPYLECAINIDKEFYNKNKEIMKYMGFWFIDNNTTKNTINDNSILKKQLFIYSNILQNLYSTLAATKSSVTSYFFIFENDNLYLGFPLIYYYENGYIDKFINYTNNPTWCCNLKGEIYNSYNFKCREYYTNCQKAKKGIFDYNFDQLNKRTIYVTNSYRQLGEKTSKNIFNICIEFDDPISDMTAYACADIIQDDLLFSFDNFNSKLAGYFLISSVGFNNVFYFPQSHDNFKTSTENIFRWDRKFFLEEKTYFLNHIQKMITSNYNQRIKDDTYSMFEEIKINGINTSDQYFYFNGEKFYFSLFPIILENLSGVKEHILSIVYFYNNQLYYNGLLSYQSNIGIKIALEVILFTVFGSGLLYLVILSFNTLAKYIVIPIKNVNYMLKGIHIGGENRLEYLDFLKKKQDENLEKLEKIFEKKIKNDLVDDTDNHILNNDNNNDDPNKNNKNDEIKEETPLIENIENIDQEKKNINDIEYNGEIINPNIDYNKKYDSESDYIEKEINFYDFDEELLQYRPLEIDRLVKVLLDLKGALLLTSTDHQVEEIINYSYSEEIFRNFKNKEGTTICQSNIGNLQSQLLKFDKAIYHLALSLQDDKLKRFLSRTLSDELDESDTLLHKISLSYNKDKDKEKINILAEKQQNNSRDNFSQKIIGVLINSRYCKLNKRLFQIF